MLLVLVAAVLSGATMSALASTADAGTFTDSDRADFRLGTSDDGAYVGSSGTGGDGVVQLKPEEAQEFDGFALPLTWESSPWAAGGTASVGGGALVVDGARAGAVLDVGPNHAVEFVATFAHEAFQHAGVGVTYQSAPWAIFSTGGGGLPVGLYARTNDGSQRNTAIPGVDPLVPHRYRIEWTDTRVDYLVDGALVASHVVAVAGPMRPLVSDFQVGGGGLSVYWLRMSPYAPVGTFTSRVLDAVHTVGQWHDLQPTAAVPPGTQARIQTRSGDSEQPDAAWSEWQDLGAGGEIVSPASRYLQYRAQLSSDDPQLTPTIERVLINYAADIDPPAPPSRPDLESASDTGRFQTDDVTSDTRPVFFGTAEDRATVRILVDGVERGSARALGGRYEVAVTPLADGAHTVIATAEDRAGNESGESEALPLRIDTQAPVTVIDTMSQLGDTAEFEFSADEPGATFECQMDDDAFAACASPRAYAGLPPGPHTYSVRATDSAGNVDATPAARTFVTNSPPAAGSVTLSPVAPARTQTLTATPTGFSDADGDQLTYQYRWFKAGAPLEASGKTLDLTQAGAVRGDEIRVEVTATDGNGGTSASVSATTTVGNAVPVAGSVTLSPVAPTRMQTVTATPAGFADADGDQLSYQYRWFKAGAPLDASGKTLDLTQAGAVRGDAIRVEVTATDGNGGTSAGAPASTTVVNAAPQIDVSGGSASAQYSDPITPFTIRASDADSDTLSFSQADSPLPNGLTLTDNGNGTATISGRALVPAGTYSPSFRVSDGHGGTQTGTATVNVTSESADVGYTGTLFVATASATATSADVTLTGQLIQQADGAPGDLTKASVDFALYKSTNLAMTTADQSCRAQATASGAVTCNLRALPADNWTVVVRTVSTGAGQYFKAVSDAVVLTVYQPATDMNASAGGWIVDPSYQNLPVAISSANRHGNLGFTVRYKKGTTTPQGQAVYIFRGVDGYTYVVKSNSWLGGGLAFGTTSLGAAFTGFSGKANVTAFSSDGQPVTGIGGGNMSYRVDAVDNASLGTPDTYAINVYTSAGKLYHQAGTQGSPVALGGGNVVVRSR
jgi:hypothetical protein